MRLLPNSIVILELGEKRDMDISYSTLGNVDILKREKAAFLSSRKVPPQAVIACYDWAAKVRDAGLCVIGGFQSALERDVLKILLKGAQPVVMVLARKMWRVVPMEYREAINAGRLLVVSPVSQKVSRVSEESAAIRNRFILEHCTSAMFASLDPGGSLGQLLCDFPELPHTVIADVRFDV